MIEYPEAVDLAKQLKSEIAGSTIARVYPPSKEHRFCFFSGDPSMYDAAMRGSKVLDAVSFGIFAELELDSGLKFCVNDGVNIRLTDPASAPKAYQLMIEFTDGRALVFTVAMYGSIVLHDDTYDNEYYQKSRFFTDPLSDGFGAYYAKLLSESNPKLTAKAFLATKQRFPGIGNGVLQDILFVAGVNPKSRLGALTDSEKDGIRDSAISTLARMTALGGRDTEKDIYGRPGGYKSLMSKNTLAFGCPKCGGAITKEAFMGGSVYYCPLCQPLKTGK